jgi:hypothetical protein
MLFIKSHAAIRQLSHTEEKKNNCKGTAQIAGLYPLPKRYQVYAAKI